MKKETLKMLGILGAATVVGAGYASAYAECCPNAMFTAKHCETQRISIGGFVSANYQWVELDDKTTNEFQGSEIGHEDPDHFNNFYMKHIRLYVRADLCDSWSAFMGIDFAGRDSTTYSWIPELGTQGARRIDSSDECRDRLPIFVDRAYIEKRWCNTVFRAGYQKVNFGAEQAIPDEYVKTINRSVATNFFMNLGRRAVAGSYTIAKNNPPYGGLAFGGNKFADRHVGLYLQGDAGCNFHYNLAIVNGYQGLCRNSTQFNNELGYFAGISYETCMCDTDLLMGVNGGYKSAGGDWTTFIDSGTPPGNIFGNHNSATWGVNPYLLANWNCLSVLVEMLYGGVEHGQLHSGGTANPWGFNFIPSYMLNDCWELVGRFSHLNTNKMGTSVHNAFGPAPDAGSSLTLDGSATITGNTFIASEAQFNKVNALYFGVNYYTVNQAVKASLGYEWARFKNQFKGEVFAPGVTPGEFNDQRVTVQAVRAQLQLLF